MSLANETVPIKRTEYQILDTEKLLILTSEASLTRQAIKVYTSGTNLRVHSAQYLAIQLHVCHFSLVDEHGIPHPMLTDARINPFYPQRPEVPPLVLVLQGTQQQHHTCWALQESHGMLQV